MKFMYDLWKLRSLIIDIYILEQLYHYLLSYNRLVQNLVSNSKHLSLWFLGIKNLGAAWLTASVSGSLSAKQGCGLI